MSEIITCFSKEIHTREHKDEDGQIVALDRSSVETVIRLLSPRGDLPAPAANTLLSDYIADSYIPALNDPEAVKKILLACAAKRLNP